MNGIGDVEGCKLLPKDHPLVFGDWLKKIHPKIQAGFAASSQKQEGTFSLGDWLQMPQPVNTPCQNPTWIWGWPF